MNEKIGRKSRVKYIPEPNDFPLATPPVLRSALSYVPLTQKASSYLFHRSPKIKIEREKESVFLLVVDQKIVWMQQEMESSLDESECEERDLFIPQLPNVESVASSALPSGLSGLDQFVNTWRSQSVAYWRLTLAEIKTNRVGYVLGFLACLVVVMV